MYTEAERKTYLVSLYGGALSALSCAEICYALPDLMDCKGFFSLLSSLLTQFVCNFTRVRY